MAHPLTALKILGDETMRSNSGKGDSSNNMRDPTTRDRTEEREKIEHRMHSSHAKAPADHRQGRQDKSQKTRGMQ